MKAILLALLPIAAFAAVIPSSSSDDVNGAAFLENLIKSENGTWVDKIVDSPLLSGQDPEIKMATADIIAYWGYPVEPYDVTTEDGYDLTVYRIPYGRGKKTTPTEKRPVVFLQHGLDGSSADWVVNLPNQAAAFVLADAGFDVWLGNFRGNQYARFHKTLSTKDHAFWAFSWDEMAQYDLPAMINYALNISKVDSLYYVGFNLGTTAGFAKFSQDKELAKKVKKFYALAPMATMSNIKGPLRMITPFTGALKRVFDLVGMDEFQPNQWLIEQVAKYFCGNVITKTVCSNAMFLIGGPDSHQLNTTRLPVYISHSPSGTSTRTIIHIGQMINSGKFQAFDFGDKKKNQERYHQDTPTEYDISAMETPISVFSGGLDWLADPTDVQNLMPKLRNVVGNTYLPDFNSFDFIWGLRAAPQIYWPMVKEIREDFAGH
jgi:lysosomal acid lipase/cholesteryl ester hydrolase